MKKRLSLIFLCFAFAINGCSNSINPYLERPIDTNLEFWITQKVTFDEFKDKGCTFLPSWFGADEYLDSRYQADISTGIVRAPEIHVTYLVTGYPDTLDDRTITQIEITDPTINVYGLTINSNQKDIKERISEIPKSSINENAFIDQFFSFSIGKAIFHFYTNKITISVPVTNKEGVEY